MAWVFLYIMLLMGGLFTVGATGDLVAAGRYDLVFGPASLAQSVYSLGDLVDDQMALQSALAREYGTTDIAEAIKLLSDRDNAAHPATIPTHPLSIQIDSNRRIPTNGVELGGRAMGDFYARLFTAITIDVPDGLNCISAWPPPIQVGSYRGP